jgi:hypothetical protein
VRRGEGAPRALCGETRTRGPQTEQHERHTRAARSKGLLSIQQSNKRTSRFAKALSGVSFTAPHLILGRSPPVGIVEGRSDGPKLGGPP